MYHSNAKVGKLADSSIKMLPFRYVGLRCHNPFKHLLKYVGLRCHNPFTHQPNSLSINPPPHSSPVDDRLVILDNITDNSVNMGKDNMKELQLLHVSFYCRKGVVEWLSSGLQARVQGSNQVIVVSEMRFLLLLCCNMIEILLKWCKILRTTQPNILLHNDLELWPSKATGFCVVN